VAMSLDPRFSASLKSLHPRGLIAIAHACSVASCSNAPVAAEPRRHGDKTGVHWYCDEHLDLAPPAAAYPIGRTCGAPAPAERYENTPCGGIATHQMIAEIDGFEGLRLVPMCGHHVKRIEERKR
jgi:hypothetical protein